MVPTSLYDDEPTDRVLYTDLDSTWRASKPMLEKNAVRTVDIYGRILQRLELLAEAQRVEALSARLQKHLERLNAQEELCVRLRKDVDALEASEKKQRKNMASLEIENAVLRDRVTKLETEVETAVYASGAVERLLANPFDSEWPGPAEYGADPPHNRASVVAIGPLPWIPKRSTLEVQLLGVLITANLDLKPYYDMRILGLFDRSYVLVELPSPDLARDFLKEWTRRLIRS